MDVHDDGDNPFQILTCDKLVGDMKKVIDEVNQITQLNRTATRILLNYFKWDNECTLESYYLNMDDWRYDTDEHIKESTKFIQNIMTWSHKAQDKMDCDNSTFTCKICYTESNQTVPQSCCHKFCKACWVSYLEAKIINEGEANIIKCPEYGCEDLIEDETIELLLRSMSPMAWKQYQKLILNTFVACNRRLTWCTSKNCENVIKVPYGLKTKPVTCSCGEKFCFTCKEPWHVPVDCDLLQKWKLKCRDENGEETLKYIKSNTKHCPKCSVSIEKNGGCNHMHCKRCDSHFCWLCKGLLVGQYSHTCNNYKEEEKDKLEAEHLERFLFFCGRYVNHLNSLKLEGKLIKNLAAQIDYLQKTFNMTYAEVIFLKKAFTSLKKCRETLMYSYVFAYYLKLNNDRLLFEANQADLENATEVLSGLLESDFEVITQKDLEKIIQKIQDKYRYCDRRREILISHVNDIRDN